MWNPASPTRNALAFLMAAAIAFLGSALLLKAGGGFPQQGGGAMAHPGMLLLAVVVLLGVSGMMLFAMAVKEFLDARGGSSAR